MDISTRLDEVFRAFFSGRATFDRLSAELASLAELSPQNSERIAERLRDLVNTGRLPADLAVLIGAKIAAPPDQPDLIDPATEPLGRPAPPAPPPPTEGGPAMPDPGGRAPPFPQPPLPDRARAGDALHDTVDRVILSAFVEDFRPYRAQKQASASERREDTSDDRVLDAALSSFKSARTRRDAENAQAGRPRGFDLQKVRSEASAGVGAMLKGRFVLDREIGRGGMGAVYRAVDRRRLEAMHDQPYVAVKLLEGDFRWHPDAFRTLEAEARKAQELSHPNIVAVHDFDRDGQNVFIVMALLEGRSLQEALDDRAARAALDVDAAIEGICLGLDYAHHRGVVHADLKPANVFILADGGVKLLDFGIASAARSSGFDPAALNALSAGYASPEMFDGAPRDPRDDVFALGCVAYLLACGRHPFDRVPANEAKSRGLKPGRPEAMPARQWRAVLAALSFERGERPATAGAFLKLYRARGLFGRLFGGRRQPSIKPTTSSTPAA